MIVTMIAGFLIGSQYRKRQSFLQRINGYDIMSVPKRTSQCRKRQSFLQRGVNPLMGGVMMSNQVTMPQAAIILTTALYIDVENTRLWSQYRKRLSFLRHMWDVAIKLLAI